MTNLVKIKIAATPSDFSNPVLDVNDQRLKSVYSWILNTKNSEAIKMLSNTLGQYNATDLSSMLKLIHGKKQILYSKLKEIADSISSKFSTSKTAEDVRSTFSVDEAINLVRPNLASIKRILKDLNFSGSLTKGTYSKDWIVTSVSNSLEESPMISLRFRSSGILFYADLLKSLKLKYDLNGILVLPLGSQEADLSGNKQSDVQVSFHLKFKN